MDKHTFESMERILAVWEKHVMRFKYFEVRIDELSIVVPKQTLHHSPFTEVHSLFISSA